MFVCLLRCNPAVRRRPSGRRTSVAQKREPARSEPRIGRLRSRGGQKGRNCRGITVPRQPPESQRSWERLQSSSRNCSGLDHKRRTQSGSPVGAFQTEYRRAHLGSHWHSGSIGTCKATKIICGFLISCADQPTLAYCPALRSSKLPHPGVFTSSLPAALYTHTPPPAAEAQAEIPRTGSRTRRLSL